MCMQPEVDARGSLFEHIPDRIELLARSRVHGRSAPLETVILISSNRSFITFSIIGNLCRHVSFHITDSQEKRA